MSLQINIKKIRIWIRPSAER